VFRARVVDRDGERRCVALVPFRRPVFATTLREPRDPPVSLP
jgi:hypothetical protein